MGDIFLRLITSILLLSVLFISYRYEQFFNILLIFLSILAFLEFIKLIIKIKKFLKKKLIITLGLIYIIIINYLLINNIHLHKDIIFYFVLICICTDIGGLIFGRIFKGKKLIKISPNKTYSGFYGSFIFSFSLMLISVNLLDINIIQIIIFTFSVCLLSQFGDIFFSYLKRLAKVKDTGNLLPGHGGILDRIDGVIVSVPINFLIYIL